MLAVIRPVKGHRYLIEAAARVLREIPDARFLLVGWYEEGPYVQELRALTQSLGIADRIIFTGGRSDTADVLAALDICVLSTLNEGFSNAIIESMAARKPVVATNVGGNPEECSPGRSARCPGAAANASCARRP
jgi:glycosyltransferase involved in cell wall biosynthesis